MHSQRPEGFVKAKFHYAIWFEAGRRQASNQIAKWNLAFAVTRAPRHDKPPKCRTVLGETSQHQVPAVHLFPDQAKLKLISELLCIKHHYLKLDLFKADEVSVIIEFLCTT